MLGIAQLINEASTYEASNDQEVALRLYKTAFNNLLDINNQINYSSGMTVMSGISPFEIRSVADYINSRTCHIQFLLKHPREAITQFKKYLDTFKQHTRAPEYAFEHSAWLSQQYLMFADMFHSAVSNGMKASRIQHPGYYYYESAMQMIERRKNITEYTNDEIRSSQMPVTQELLSMITANNFATFLRQCGWTCINTYTGPPVAPALISNAVANSTKNQGVGSEPINYSELIIKALYRAMEYFEEWNRPRLYNYIIVLLANEHMNTKEFQKASALYAKSLTWYERENWKPLVEYIADKLTNIKTSASIR